jgi:hypothetical protein
MRPIALLLLMTITSLCCHGLGETELPEVAKPAAGPLSASTSSNSIWLELDIIERRYAEQEWLCSQFLYDMTNVARRAETRMPEVVELIRVGAHPGAVDFLLMLMGERALLAVPDLLELADAPDPVVRERAFAALSVALEAATRQDQDEGCDVTELVQQAAEQDVAAVEAR